MGLLDAIELLPDARQNQQDLAQLRLQFAANLILFGGEWKVVAQLGELGEFPMGAKHREVVRLIGAGERLLPAGDAIGERAVDILKSLFGGDTGGGVAGFSQTVEDAAGFDGLFGFKREKGKLEAGGFVVRVEFERLFKFVTGGSVFAGTQQRVGQILWAAALDGCWASPFRKKSMAES